jgi:2-hydroxychromene-2-carboxylate isomerase
MSPVLPDYTEWFIDILSPYAYLQAEKLHALGETNVQVKPVVLAVLLTHFGNIGPAEIPTKRRFTYRFVHWQAAQLGVPMKIPAVHPFNPLPWLRLIVAADSRFNAALGVLRALFAEGLDPLDPAALERVGRGIGLTDPLTDIQRAEVKSILKANTDAAITAEVFGVPTLKVDRALFWGFDATDMARAYARGDRSLEGLDVDAIPVGAARAR